MPKDDAEREARIREGIVRAQQDIAHLDLDLPAVLAVIAERARALTGATGGTVEWLEGQEFVCLASAGKTARQVGVRMQREGSLAGEVVQHGQAVYCEDVLADPRINQTFARRIDVRSLIIAPLRAGGEFIGAIKVMSDQPRAFAPSDKVNLQILVESLAATLQRHRVTAQLRASEAQYRLLFNHNPQPMWVYAQDDLRFLAVNDACMQHYGYGEAEFLAMTLTDLLPPGERQAHLQTLSQWPNDTPQRKQSQCHLHKAGHMMSVEVSSDCISFNGRPAQLAMVVDVTERLRAEQELARVSRAQRMLSASNEAHIRVSDEITLLQEVCQVAVSIGGYRLAHVTYAELDPARTLRCVAWAGAGDAPLAQIPSSWAEDDTPAPVHPFQQAVLTGQSVVVEDLAQASQTAAPWLKQAHTSGFCGLVTLPLKNAERTFGVLTLLASEVMHLGKDEVNLLEELADNLAFGIGHIQAEQERQRFQDTVLKVATAVSAKTGQAFFVQLASNMAQALGAQGAVVARFLPGERLAQARTLAVVIDGEERANFEYTLDHAQRDSMHTADGAVIRSRAAERFSRMPLLAHTCAQAYGWQRLDNSAGEPVGVLSVLFRASVDKTALITSTLRIFAARCAAEMERQEADARIRDQASLLDKAQDAIIVRTLDDRLLYWNKGAERLYGWTAEEALGQPLGRGVYQDEGAYDAANRMLLKHGEWVSEFEQWDRHGRELVIEGRWTLLRDEHEQPVSVLSISTDITTRKASEQEIHRLAFYDPLTQLPNRQLLVNRLKQSLVSNARTGLGGALLLIDLDDFKLINDTLGHDMGDLLLQQVATRLSQCVRKVDTVARFGGDEFVVMLTDVSANPSEVISRARRIGEKILQALNARYALGDYEHNSTCSVGIAPFFNPQDQVGELLKQADLAMYQAKSAGRNALRFFDPEMQAVVTERAALEADLRQALARHEFLLHYQPQVNAQGEMAGVEALVRWQHPQRGRVSPAAFIPLAEETGLIVPLGLWVLETACTLLASWSVDGTAPRTMAVNVSLKQFRHPDFVAQVSSVLQATGAPARALKLELTESLLADDVEQVIAKISALKALGLGFSLDDFGTGYSSLAYLKRLPLDQLKIDQSFVRDVMHNASDGAIVRTIIALGQSLGMHVIAEGVETEAQRNFLAEHGCNAYQGYLYSRPLNAADLETYLLSEK